MADDEHQPSRRHCTLAGQGVSTGIPHCRGHCWCGGIYRHDSGRPADALPRSHTHANALPWQLDVVKTRTQTGDLLLATPPDQPQTAPHTKPHTPQPHSRLGRRTVSNLWRNRCSRIDGKHGPGLLKCLHSDRTSEASSLHHQRNTCETRKYYYK